MLKQEFESRVKFEVSNKEFDAINEVYMNCDLDKDEFCKMWKKMNAKRIKSYNDAEQSIKDMETRNEKMRNIEARLSNYTFAQIKPYGVLFFTEEEREVIKEAGIALKEGRGYREMIDIATDIYIYNHNHKVA